MWLSVHAQLPQAWQALEGSKCGADHCNSWHICEARENHAVRVNPLPSGRLESSEELKTNNAEAWQLPWANGIGMSGGEAWASAHKKSPRWLYCAGREGDNWKEQN